MAVDFTCEQAIRTLGVTPDMLDHLIDEGKIPVMRDGIRTVIPRQAILDYMATVTTVGKERKKGG